MSARTASVASNPPTIDHLHARATAPSSRLQPKSDGSPSAHNKITGAASATIPSPTMSDAWSNMNRSLTDLGELQMIAPAAVPFDRRSRPRQSIDPWLVAVERAVAIDTDVRRVGVERGEPNPFVADQAADRRLPLHNPQQGLRPGLDDEQDADRFVNFDHLPRQPGAQVARRPVHHAQKRGDVVGQLGAAAETGVIDDGKVVFETDAGADRNDCPEDPRQNRSLRIVPAGVVGTQKRPPIEEQSAGPLPAGDDTDGVGRVAPLRPDLRQILRPGFGVLPGGGVGKGQWRGQESPAAFVRVAIGGASDDLSYRLELRPV